MSLRYDNNNWHIRTFSRTVGHCTTMSLSFDSFKCKPQDTECLLCSKIRMKKLNYTRLTDCHSSARQITIVWDLSDQLFCCFLAVFRHISDTNYNSFIEEECGHVCCWFHPLEAMISSYRLWKLCHSLSIHSWYDLLFMFSKPEQHHNWLTANKTPGVQSLSQAPAWLPLILCTSKYY